MTYTITGAKYSPELRKYMHVRVTRPTYAAASSAKWSLLAAGWAAKIQVKFVDETDLPKRK